MFLIDQRKEDWSQFVHKKTSKGPTRVEIEANRPYEKIKRKKLDVNLVYN